MEKTAVEWLIEQVKSQKYIEDVDFEQAKEMEKSQLYNFYVQGGIDGITEADRTVEDYYNETFNK
jgi:hypothetical protein